MITQKDKELKETEPDQEIVYDSYNKWSIEIEAGQSKGTKPMLLVIITVIQINILHLTSIILQLLVDI
jgi:hypothetical protein